METCAVKSSMLASAMKSEFNVDQIKKIWILDLILRAGSLKGAAALAKVSPSAVSQSLAALEKSIGKPLIVRGNGNLLPTQDALSILEIVRPAFEAFGRLNEFGSQPVPKMTWLNFGTYESIAVDILPGLLHRLRDKMPTLRLGLRIGRSANLLTMIRKGELCSAIVTENDEIDRFYNVPIASDRLGVYVSSRHPIAQLGWKATERFGLGSLAPGKDGFPRYYSRFLNRFKSTRPSLLSESFETLRVATASGAIASVLPHRVAQRTNDLLEITPEGTPKDSGSHRIFVVSPANCDKEETDFLAQEVQRVLVNPP